MLGSFYLVALLSISAINAQLDEERDYLKQKGFYLEIDDEERENFRLPKDILPSYYKLDIFPDDVANRQFHGVVEITIAAVRPTDRVVLNVESIVVDKSTLVEGSAETDLLVAGGCTQSEVARKFQLLECMTKAPLSIDKTYKLKIEYTGRFANDNRGLYISRYTQDGQVHDLYTTHFGQQARRLLPCFDEPQFKAQFQLNFVRPEAHNITASNTNIEKSYPYPVTGEAWGFMDEYKPTTPIAPYILAVISARFHFRSDTRRGDHKFGIFVRPHASDQANFAQDVGPKFIDAFGEWTGLDYYEFEHVEKMDMGSIPDFSAGGKCYQSIEFATCDNVFDKAEVNL